METAGFTLKMHQMLSVHTTPEEFKNGRFNSENTSNVSVYTTPEEFENGRFNSENTSNVSVHTTPEEFKKQQV